MLQVEGLCAGYEGADVLHGVSVSVEPSTVVAIIGANGAGKSTLLRTMSGLIRRSAGSVSVDGQHLRLRSEREVVRAGIAHVPEGRQVFADLTVQENLYLGAYATKNGRELAARVEDMLALFPVLRSRLRHYAGSLSGGQQQMLAIARGLMGHPKYLLLDEPSLGLAPLIVETIFQTIVELRQRDVGILLVEQNGWMALSNADHAYLLEQGRITLSGTGKELLENPAVVERYLGVGVAIGETERHRGLGEQLRRALSI